MTAQLADRLTGVHTIMPTPFSDDGALDLASLERLTDFLIRLGVDGLVVLGVLGEAPKLSQAEQEQVIATTVAAAAGRVPVLAGTGAAGTQLAVERSAAAIAAGAAGLLVAPPPVQNDTVIFEYYRRIDAAVGAKIVLHDYPAATGISLPPALVLRLHTELGGVGAIKLEESPSAPKVSALRAASRSLSIVGGLGGLYLIEELGRGADGIMTGFSYPEVLIEVYRAHAAGDLPRARAAFYKAAPLLRFEFQPGIGLALRKEVYRRRGAIASAHVRHPGAQIDAQLAAELDAALFGSGLA